MTVRMTWNGQAAKAARRAGTTKGLGDAAEHVLAKAREVVPIEEATLSRSGAASVDDDVAAVSFDTVYAARQHEELGWRHDAGRTAKYLERPHAQTWPEQQALIAQAVRQELQ